jgi:hypothetical protein
MQPDSARGMKICTSNALQWAVALCTRCDAKKLGAVLSELVHLNFKQCRTHWKIDACWRAKEISEFEDSQARENSLLSNSYN